MTDLASTAFLVIIFICFVEATYRAGRIYP